MTYDLTGNLLTITKPLIGATTYSDFDYMGNKGKETDPNGNMIVYTYDVLGRVKAITNQADNSTTQYFYAKPSGSCSTCRTGGGTRNIERIVYPEGNQFSYSYNTSDNLTAESDNDGNSIKYTYDNAGNVLRLQVTDVDGMVQKKVDYEYDALNRLTKIINPDNSYTLYGYDPRGNLNSIKTPNGNVVLFSYDALKRTSKFIQPSNFITTFSYDKRGNVITVTDPSSITTTYEYDGRNMLVKTASADTGATTYTHDANGNRKTRTDANGITKSYAYDELNRLKAVYFPDSAQNITYAYDTCTNGKGNLCWMQDQSGNTTYSFSAKGQIARETKVIDESSYITEYSYDKNNNFTAIKYPSGRVITYTYANDRPASVLQNNTPLALNVTYKPFGGISSLTYGNNVTQTISYDQQYRFTSIKAGTIQDIVYSYDSNWNITGIINNLDVEKNKTYTYDALDRLATANGPWGALTYTYDVVGNRLTEAAGANQTTYTYEANRLKTAVGGKNLALAYDNNGNTAIENLRQYIYNQNQRLVKVTDSGIVKGEYVYNGDGQRVMKSVGGQTTIFIYDINGNMISESAGGTLTDYVFFNRRPLAKIDGSSVYYYHNDHLGTPQKMSDGRGTVVWYGEFLPFGEPLSIEGIITNNLRFPWQYFDEETGLNYNYFRDYKPIIGRYIQADPVGLFGGVNRFVYVRNRPITRRDTYGLFADGQRKSGARDYEGYEYWPPRGHSDFSGGDRFDYTLEDHDSKTHTVFGDTSRHFRPLRDEEGKKGTEPEVQKAIDACNVEEFPRAMHRGQDYFSHWAKGYRWDPGNKKRHCNGYGHACNDFMLKREDPDADDVAWQKAEDWTNGWLKKWDDRCCKGVNRGCKKGC